MRSLESLDSRDAVRDKRRECQTDPGTLDDGREVHILRQQDHGT